MSQHFLSRPLFLHSSLASLTPLLKSPLVLKCPTLINSSFHLVLIMPPFLYKYLCLCFNKSVFNWTFYQLLRQMFEPLDCPSVCLGPSEAKPNFTKVNLKLKSHTPQHNCNHYSLAIGERLTDSGNSISNGEKKFECYDIDFAVLPASPGGPPVSLK